MSRLRFAVVGTVLGATLLASGSAQSSIAAPARVTGPAVVGKACAPGVGVTVAVDFTNLPRNAIRLGCAPGAQPDGFSALAGAGFRFAEGSIPGFLCTIDGLPHRGSPYCEESHYWAYSKSDGTEPWDYSRVGGSTHRRIEIDAVEGWKFVSFDAVHTSPGLAIADLAPYRKARADAIIGSHREPKRVTTHDKVRFTVTVRGGHGLDATGRVTVSIKGRLVTQSHRLHQGEATFHLGRLREGTKKLTIRYAGDDKVRAGHKTVRFKVFAA
jgi:hypothetical protein